MMSTWIYCLWGPFLWSNLHFWEETQIQVKKQSLRAPPRRTESISRCRTSQPWSFGLTFRPRFYISRNSPRFHVDLDKPGKDMFLKSKMKPVVKYDVYLDILLMGSISVIKSTFLRGNPNPGQKTIFKSAAQKDRIHFKMSHFAALILRIDIQTTVLYFQEFTKIPCRFRQTRKRHVPEVQNETCS